MGAVEQINQINVGTEVELTSAQLAHREHAKVAGGVDGPLEDSRSSGERSADTFVGEPRQHGGGSDYVEDAQQIGDGDTEEDIAFEAAEDHSGGALVIKIRRRSENDLVEQLGGGLRSRLPENCGP